MDLALNNLQRLIRHKTKQTKPNLENIQLYGYMNIICIIWEYLKTNNFMAVWTLLVHNKW